MRFGVKKFLENQKFDSMLNGSGESESRSEKFSKLERRLRSIEQEKAYLKQCWRLLKCALDKLYSVNIDKYSKVLMIVAIEKQGFPCCDCLNFVIT